MKITDVRAYVVVPEFFSGVTDRKYKSLLSEWQWTFVVIDTDEGISGWGESSNTRSRSSPATRN